MVVLGQFNKTEEINDLYKERASLKYNRIHYSVLLVTFFLILVAFSNGNVQKYVQKRNDSKAENHQIHWSYEGYTGPDYWGELDPSFSACVNGKEQSPINIVTSQLIKPEESENMKIQYESTTFNIVNNGHTIQANAEGAKNSITLDGTIYKLHQFHFHTPSEHLFNGQSFDMELHFVHKSDSGGYAVLGWMIKEGAESTMLSNMWKNLSKTEEDTSFVTRIDLLSLLPADKNSFHYNGSFTTPLCTEGVKWVLLEEPHEMSNEQIAAFQSIFPINQRPVQPLNGREVLVKGIMFIHSTE